MEGHISINIWAAQIGLDGFCCLFVFVFIMMQSLMDKKEVANLGRVQGEYDQNILYDVFKELK